MDLEAPADGWVVFFGVALVSIGMTGVALSIPTAPPPDANAAANTIDRVAGSTYGGSATNSHQAEAVWVGPKRFGLKNEKGGKSYGSIAFGTMTPVYASPNDRLFNKLSAIVHGTPWQEEFSSEAAFVSAVETVQNRASAHTNEWRPANGTLRVRTIVLGDNTDTDTDDTRITIVSF